ncbi:MULTISPECIES: DUF5000 domain-containing lipoprotein [Sphingobacterium]|uniref:DUF5000 domain-containing lipoprotein n=1 Tax=Sphingobacterium TaxID=28453 RepID=UPI0013DBBFB2|nr:MULTISPECIES: DUF5000 domain-containing lipoprotein [unclassified Sphingobacterium]
MKKIYIILISFLIAACIQSCSEDLGVSKPLLNDDKAPGKILDVRIENRPGEAKLVYKIPGDNDLLYVKAEYEIRPGVKREVRSFKTNDSLIVDGFGLAKEYEVKLYAVDNGENISEPITVRVNPLNPPVQTVLQHLQIINDFGGVGLLYDNPSNAELSFVVVKKQDGDQDLLVKTFYTKAKEGAFNIRGYPVEPIVFGVYIKDKFGNLSETVYKNILPIEEVRLDRLKFSEYTLPTDVGIHSDSWKISNMWDDKFGEKQGFHSSPSIEIVMPIWVTFDMGVKAKLSRFKQFQRTSTPNAVFDHNNLKRFELWGSNNPSTDGSWDSWVLLGTYESIKPSGLPRGTVTNEDVAYAKAGEEFNVPTSAPAVRYIRVKALENWSGGHIMQIAEMQFWGQVQ